MVRLHRAGVVEPKGWKRRVARALGDEAGFLRRARAFQKLPLRSPRRRDGFRKYARGLLAKCGGDLPAVWRRSKQLKKALRDMTKGHCAYCQKGIEKGHVDHVLPKSLFPLLAYLIGNYLYACARCNEAKSNDWRGGFIRPDKRNPAGRFVFHQDGHVEGAPRDRQAKLTVEVIGLDRAGLRTQRREAIKRALSTLVPLLDEPGLPDAFRREHARRYVVPALSPYSAAINQNVRRAWGERFPGLTLI
jgi:uncharacterized protein (TIGR02646 family)